jgi:archaellum component FlaC
MEGIKRSMEDMERSMGGIKISMEGIKRPMEGIKGSMEVWRDPIKRFMKVSTDPWKVSRYISKHFYKKQLVIV